MQTSDIFIYHHLGLGDHIICNGLVRSIVAQEEYKNSLIHLFCKEHNCDSVSFMYKDISNLYVLQGDDAYVNYWYSNKPNLITIGHQYYSPSANSNFDTAFYKQMGVPFSARWDKFYVSRDLCTEKDLFHKLNLTPNNYIFLHDDPTRNLVIDRTHIQNKELPVITPSMFKTSNIFDFLTVMEHAAELHCMDSCFRLLFDSINNINKLPKIFHHISLLNNIKDMGLMSSSKLQWTII